MTPFPSSVRKILERHLIKTSAPCRIDSGGTWDIKAMALPLEGIEPVTINMALDLRTEIVLSPFKNGRVMVRSDGFSQEEEHSFNNLPFNSAFGLFFSAVSYFGFHGLMIDIRSDSPIKSALGGSSTALIALLKGLSKLSALLSGKKGLTSQDILHLGYHLEDGISGGNCGIQDQAAAIYGGVNRWRWNHGHRRSIFKRESILNRNGQRELSKRILVAYSGASHISSNINQSWIKDFLAGLTRSGWVAVNNIVKEFGQALKERNWETATDLLKTEMAIRREITPDALIKVTEVLIDQAEEAGCAARFAGAGGGGSVWALGEPNRLQKLRNAWDTTLAAVPGGRILDCSIDPTGVI